MKERAVEVGMMDDRLRQTGRPVETELEFEPGFEPVGSRRMPGAMYLRARERREREDAALAVPATPPPPSPPPSRHPRTASREVRGHRWPGATIGAGLAATLVTALVMTLVTLAVTGAWTPGGPVAHPDTARQPAVTGGPAVVDAPASADRTAAPAAPLTPSPSVPPAVTSSVPPAVPPSVPPDGAAGRPPDRVPAQPSQPPQLTITTTPAGAHVTVRDVGWGTTPPSGISPQARHSCA